jgi:hypothetical protein
LRIATTLAEEWFWQGHGARASDLLAPLHRRFADTCQTSDFTRARLLLDALPAASDGRRLAGQPHQDLSRPDALG